MVLLSVSHGRARAKREWRRGRCCYPSLMGERERSEKGEEGAAAIHLPWARSKKRALLLSISHGFA